MIILSSLQKKEVDHLESPDFEETETDPLDICSTVKHIKEVSSNFIVLKFLSFI